MSVAPPPILNIGGLHKGVDVGTEVAGRVVGMWVVVGGVSETIIGAEVIMGVGGMVLVGISELIGTSTKSVKPLCDR